MGSDAVTPSPVLAGLLLEEFIKLQHLLPGDHVDFELGEHLFHEPQVVVHKALPIMPHVVAGAPEDKYCVLAGVEQFVATSQDPLHAGVCNDTQGGAVTDVTGVTSGGGSVVHADHALGPVDLFTSTASNEVTWASHQGAGVAVHPERLSERRGQRRRRRKKKKTSKQTWTFSQYLASTSFREYPWSTAAEFLFVFCSYLFVSLQTLFSTSQKCCEVLFSLGLYREMQSRQKCTPRGTLVKSFTMYLRQKMLCWQMGSDRASWVYVACHIALRLVETLGSYKGFTLNLSLTPTQQKNVCLPPKPTPRCRKSPAILYGKLTKHYIVKKIQHTGQPCQ